MPPLFAKTGYIARSLLFLFRASIQAVHARKRRRDPGQVLFVADGVEKMMGTWDQQEV